MEALWAEAQAVTSWCVSGAGTGLRRAEGIRWHRMGHPLVKLGQVSKSSLSMLFNQWEGRSAVGAGTSWGTVGALRCTESCPRLSPSKCSCTGGRVGKVAGDCAPGRNPGPLHQGEDPQRGGGELRAKQVCSGSASWACVPDCPAGRWRGNPRHTGPWQRALLSIMDSKVSGLGNGEDLWGRRASAHRVLARFWAGRSGTSAPREV